MLVNEVNNPTAPLNNFHGIHVFDEERADGRRRFQFRFTDKRKFVQSLKWSWKFWVKTFIGLKKIKNKCKRPRAPRTRLNWSYTRLTFFTHTNLLWPISSGVLFEPPKSLYRQDWYLTHRLVQYLIDRSRRNAFGTAVCDIIQCNFTVSSKMGFRGRCIGPLGMKLVFFFFERNDLFILIYAYSGFVRYHYSIIAMIQITCVNHINLT